MSAHDVARDCPPACATIHTSPFGRDEHHQRFGSVAAHLDPTLGDTPIDIAVEVEYPTGRPATIVVLGGEPDAIDETAWHLTAARAEALAARLTAAVAALRQHRAGAP